MDFEYQEHYSYLTNICLNLTDACNFACKYCFVEQNPHYMSYETALKAVDFLMENLHKKWERNGNTNVKGCITYFGGEPTLMWDSIIVPLTKHIKENNLPITLNMTTNGSLLNEERIKFLKDNNIPILLSMDGGEYTQTFNRPCRNENINSFEAVSKNIPNILKYFPNTTYRATVYAPTADKTFENYIYAIEHNFKNVYFLPDSRHPWNEEQIKSLRLELGKIYSFLDFCFSSGFMPPISFRLIDRSFENILRRDLKIVRNTIGEREKIRSIMRCGLGTTLGSIGYDGSIYGCQEQTSKNNENIFYIGNIYEGGIDVEKHKRLLSKFKEKKASKCENQLLCESCLLKDICYDFACPSTSYDLYKDFFTDSEIHCYWNRWMTEFAIILMEKQKDNPIFQDYLKEQCNYNKYFPEKKEG